MGRQPISNMGTRIKIGLLVAVTILLQVLDLVSTRIALASPHIIELNPFGNYFVSRGLWWEFLFVKFGVLSLVFGLTMLFATKESIMRMAFLMNIIMAVVVLNNFYWGFGG